MKELVSFFKLDGSSHTGGTSFVVHKSSASSKKPTAAKVFKAKPSPQVAHTAAAELDESQFTKF